MNFNLYRKERKEKRKKHKVFLCILCANSAFFAIHALKMPKELTVQGSDITRMPNELSPVNKINFLIHNAELHLEHEL